jgi:lipopolysaccharide/colanic/teichoic acid biosynthesis glycosyltransferase
MTGESSSIGGWYELVAREFKSFRLSFRPRHPNGFFFGFLFRLVTAIFAVLWSTVAVIAGVLVFHFFKWSESWELSEGVLITFGALISLTIFAGEHMRSRVYERFTGERENAPGDDVVTAREFEVISRGLSGLDATQRVAPRRLRTVQLVGKRAIDLALATVGLMLLSPLMILLSLLIKFDSPGPILFRQTRVALNGRAFRIIKFRTMRIGEAPNENGSVAVRNDPRITRVGRFLRRASIDELPQLFNVLKGEMSIVGPRAHALAHGQTLGNFSEPLSEFDWVKPGITGLAQVKGYRGEVATPGQIQDRIDLDLWYVEHWSLWLDIRVMLMTVVVVLRGRNAQ